MRQNLRALTVISASRGCVAIVAAAVLGALSFSASRAAAEDNVLTVQNLYFSCKSPENSSRWALCYGYVAGIGNAMQFVGYEQNEHPDLNYIALAICGNMSNAAMVQAFVNWAEKNPQHWQDHQVTGVVTALVGTWPCKPKK